jgi:hypothetical protein
VLSVTESLLFDVEFVRFHSFGRTSLEDLSSLALARFNIIKVKGFNTKPR